MLRFGFEKISQMPWYFPWSEAIKKRAIRYLLQRYLGQFLEEKLSLDQLTVDLSQGTGTIKTLTLDVASINEVSDQMNIPVGFVDGYIGEISVSIPWHAILTESCFVEVKGLMLTVVPKQRINDISMVDSMIESMTSSVQIAQECLNQESESNENIEAVSSFRQMSSNEGVEQLARAIDTVLNRIKVRFVDTVIRLEYQQQLAEFGLALELRIAKVDYFDEAGLEKYENFNKEKNSESSMSAITTKKLLLEGVQFFTDEFLVGKALGKSHLLYTSGSNLSPESSGSKLSGSVPSDLCKTAEGSPLDDKNFLYNTDKSVRTLITNNDIPVEPVLFAKLIGTQEIRLSLKQNENICLPKVDIMLNFGSLIAFLSPRQVHLLLRIVEGVSAPEKFDTGLEDHKYLVKQKKMEINDYNKVETELINRTQSPNISSQALSANNGWSSSFPLDDSEFLPMVSENKRSNMTSSEISLSSDMGSSSSNINDSTLKSTLYAHYRHSNFSTLYMNSAESKRHVKHVSNIQNLNDDVNSVESCSKISIKSAIIFILHEDMLTPSLNYKGIVSNASVIEQQCKSEEFFTSLSPHSFNGFGVSELVEERDKLSNACRMNHLRLIAGPMRFEHTEKNMHKKWETVLHCSVGCGEILECLFETVGQASKVEYVEILTFLNNANSSQENKNDCFYYGAIKPKVTLTVNHSVSRLHSGSQRNCIPQADIKMYVDDCFCELDISILDRLSTLIHGKEIFKSFNSTKNNSEHNKSSQACFKSTMEDNLQSQDPSVNIFLCASSLSVILRFPIPDLRPLSDMSRVPWWKRNIRKDSLHLNILNFELSTIFDTYSSISTSYEIKCSDLHILFQESDETPLSLVRVNNSSKAEIGLEQTKIVITSHTSQSWASFEGDRKENYMTKSMMGFLEEVPELEPSPFSKRKVATQQVDGIPAEEIIIPSGKNEIMEFISKTLKNVKLHIDIHLPEVQLLLPSKHTCEVIYNRLISDLILWDFSAPTYNFRKNAGNINNFDIPSVFMNEAVFGLSHFTVCQSAYTKDSESDEEEESNFFSIYEQRCRLKKAAKIEVLEKYPTEIGITLKIGHGLALLRMPVRDEKSCVLPCRHGDLAVILKHGTVFATSGHNGDINLGYACISAQNLEVFHSPNNVTPDSLVVLSSSTPLSTSHMHAVLYPSDAGVITKLGTHSASGKEDLKEMLTVGIKMQFNELRNMKTLLLTGALRGATLRHFMTNPSDSWVAQLNDFLDMLDYPIAGYAIPDVVTEVNFHLWSCGIDYRPLYLPLRTFVTVDSLSVLSNLTITSSSSVLRFIIEDVALFLSQNLSASSVDLLKNYICIADIGVLELCIRTYGGKDQFKPKFDLSMSNNVIHFRTCVDSCKAFLELIKYLSGNGDLVGEVNDTGISVIKEQNEPATLKCDDALSPLENLKQQHEMVKHMMQDAMVESSASSDDEKLDAVLSNTAQKDVEVFLFPDESGNSHVQQDYVHGELKDDTVSALSEALREHVEICDDLSFSTDEEFCILGDAPGSGIKSPSGKPVIRVLCSEEVKIIDDHFAIPVSRVNQLKAPKKFPEAVKKYSLKELTLIWHMYGGLDFSNCDKESKSKKVLINDYCESPEIHVRYSTCASPSCGYKAKTSAPVKSGSANSKSNPTSPVFSYNSPPVSPEMHNRKSWQAAGGSNRQHDVMMELHLNKIKFQYEVYPETMKHVSRCVFLINDIEIRDKLASSKINKFFYQFSSEACPRQSQANMLQVKAYVCRPDGVNGPEETSLKVSLRPIRLHIDQDALLFFCTFFDALSSCGEGKYSFEEEDSVSIAQVPIMSVNLSDCANWKCSKNDPVLINIENNLTYNDKKANSQGPNPTFFRTFIFSPRVPIKIDYHGKHIDFNSQYGPLIGLLIGLGQLDHSEITLKRLEHKTGILGIPKLKNYVLTEWINDILGNQLPSFLQGVGPMHSVGQLIGGLRDLVWYPIEQYQRDGRLVRGIQRGASSFSTSYAHATIDLVSRFVGCIQSAAETMYDMVSPGPSVRTRSYRRMGQPQDIREGVATAYGLVRHGLGDTANNIWKVASEEHQHKGFSGAVGGLLRQIPPSVVQPIILASEATCTVLGGVKNQLVPDARKEAVDKWKE